MAKVLKYRYKDDANEWRTATFKNLTLTEEDGIESLLTNPRRPGQFRFRGQVLKSSSIELYDPETLAPAQFKPQRLDPSNESDKQVIRAFERELEDSGIKGMNRFFKFLQQKGIIDFNEATRSITVLNPAMYTEYQLREAGYSELRVRREYEKKKEASALDAYLGEAPQMERVAAEPIFREEEGEIEVKDIPF